MTSSSDLGPPPDVWAFQERLLPVCEAVAAVWYRCDCRWGQRLLFDRASTLVPFRVLEQRQSGRTHRPLGIP
jgi:hypothetical protein